MSRLPGLRTCLSFAVALIVAVLFITGCGGKREKVERAFYEWRSRISYSAADVAALDSLKVTRLYVRFFDVQWDEDRNEPYPESVVRFESPFPPGVTVIPTVYITNDVMKQIHEDEKLELLARKIKEKIERMGLEGKAGSFPEVQIDCDWTASSRLNYFALLRQIKQQFPAKTLSATIRLHQIRYRVETGIPPVDRGMLMAYNVGNVISPEETNSIFSEEEVGKYLGNLDGYPLPLDAALPVFSWGVRFHFDRFAALIDNVTEGEMGRSRGFRRIDKNLWQAEMETELRGEPIYPGDVIRVEEPNPQEVQAIARRIAANRDDPTISVALYRFDPAIIARHSPEYFRAIYESFEP